jgi:hypothetical protein
MKQLNGRPTKESNPASYLRFTDGLIIDGTRCPLGVLAKQHWTLVEGLIVPGEPNAECGCPKQAEVA